MSTSPEELMVNDLVEAIITQAEKAKVTWLKSKGTENEAFDAGVVQGYWQILTSLKSRVSIYEIELDQYDFSKFEPDKIWQSS